VRRARTAAGLPGRVVAVEDRCVALETHVVAKLDEMRAELAEVRSLLGAVLETETDVAGLVGRLLERTAERIDALERDLPARNDRLGATAGESETS
jgi:hypothetical protein